MGFLACFIVLGTLWLICGGSDIIKDGLKPRGTSESATRAIWGDYIHTKEGQEALKRAKEYDAKHPK